MRAGFTGTQVGMTGNQTSKLQELLISFGITELHNGDCVGSDFEADIIAKYLKLRTIGHPPIDQRKRAFCQFDEERTAKEYLKRNKEIVNESSILFATPREFIEQLRSGTWSTIRYARKLHRRVIIIYPDGSLGE
jgi:hypothetical protein